jgi:hypothetical protein
MFLRPKCPWRSHRPWGRMGMGLCDVWSVECCGAWGRHVIYYAPWGGMELHGAHGNNKPGLSLRPVSDIGDLGMRMRKTWSCPLLVRLGSAAPVQTTQAPSASAPAPCSACGDQVFLELLSITPLELLSITPLELRLVVSTLTGIWHAPFSG